jgi:RNA polymerase-binding transcription factor DksA
MHAVPADGPEAAAGQIDEGARAHELREIEEALRRIVDGSYGTCVACGGALGMQRIRAIPEARYCLSCSGQRSAD